MLARQPPINKTMMGPLYRGNLYRQSQQQSVADKYGDRGHTAPEARRQPGKSSLKQPVPPSTRAYNTPVFPKNRPKTSQSSIRNNKSSKTNRNVASKNQASKQQTSKNDASHHTNLSEEVSSKQVDDVPTNDVGEQVQNGVPKGEPQIESADTNVDPKPASKLDKLSESEMHLNAMAEDMQNEFVLAAHAHALPSFLKACTKFR